MIAVGPARPTALPAARAELVFTRVHGNDYSVWVARADGSHPRKLVSNGVGGALSADGRWVTFARGHNVYLVATAARRPRRLGDVSYAWAPRGARLAIGDSRGLHLLDAESGERRTLVRGRHLVVDSFAPSGSALVYTRQTFSGDEADLRSDIFTVRLADRRVRRLTRGGHSGEPVWGRDWIAYRHYRRTKWPQIGGLWFMRSDGSETHLFARGDQHPGRAHYGLMPLEFSRDGAHLLACTDAEFGCSPVTFVVASRQRYAFVAGDFPPHKGALLAPEDMSADGRRLLVWVGSVDGSAPDDVYAVPFAGGKPSLVAANAVSASWRG